MALKVFTAQCSNIPYLHFITNRLFSACILRSKDVTLGVECHKKQNNKKILSLNFKIH